MKTAIEWINIEIKKPNDNQWVLFFMNDEVFMGQFIDDYKHNSLGWSVDVDNFGTIIESQLKHLKYWMPLPKPPSVLQQNI
jgi:hypothetical protein